MTPDDARAALDAALPCPRETGGMSDCFISGLSSEDDRHDCPAWYRAAVWPIIAKLCEDVKHWTQLYEEAASRRIEESKKLVAAKAERDTAIRHRDNYVEDRGRTVEALGEKLAQAEARIEQLCQAHEEQFIAREKAEALLTEERELRQKYQRERAELSDKLHGTPCEQIRHEQEVADLRALLQRRPHLGPFGMGKTISLVKCGNESEEKLCASLGGACAK